MTTQRAMELSGRSRRWFERRLQRWEEQDLARRVTSRGPWLLSRAVVPARRAWPPGKGFPPDMLVEEILDHLEREV